MDRFRVLVVEDEPAIVNQLKQSFEKDSRIEVLDADCLEDAKTKIRGSFLHAAIVDMQLKDPKKPSNYSGRDVLYYLKNHRPSCRRILNTEYSSEHRGAFFDLLAPENPVIHGALDKRSNRSDPRDILQSMASEWL